MLRASEADCRNYHGLCQNKAACAEKDGGRKVMPAVGWLITATSDEYDSEIYPSVLSPVRIATTAGQNIEHGGVQKL